MHGGWEKLLLKTHHDFRGLEQGTAGVFLPVSFRRVLLLNLAFKVFSNLSSLYPFKPFLSLLLLTSFLHPLTIMHVT